MFDKNEEGIRQGKTQSSTKASEKCKIYEENKNFKKKIKIARKKNHVDEERLKAECGLA